jgi:Tol biopolymer transport system component
MNADGSRQVNLTNSSRGDSGAVWSPDGRSLAFYSKRSGNEQIYLMDADGQNLRRLTNNQANDTWMSWSPDGSRLAFQSDRGGNFEIFVMNADGELTRPTHNLADDLGPLGRLMARASRFVVIAQANKIFS